MLEIKQRRDKWRLTIEEEEWEVKDKKELKEVINILIDLKSKYGQLPENKK